VDLVRDLLDKQVVDRNGRLLGRVDSIIFELRDGAPPVVAGIEIGLVTIAHRLHPFLGRCARALEVVLGVDANRPVRVPFSRILDFDTDVKVDVAAAETGARAVEHKARAIVASIPGA
jgi:sporulation protein YlmC with PRC-barrel domain